MTMLVKKCITAFASTAVLALGLHACGGGGGSPVTDSATMLPDDRDTMMTDDDEATMPDVGEGMMSGVGMATEFGDERLTASPVASPEALSEADTLVSFVDSDTPFGPVVSPIKHVVDDIGNSGLVFLEQGDSGAYVESATVRDSQGRFTIVYVVNDQREEVEFGPEHVIDQDQVYGHYITYEREIDHTEYYMWNNPVFSNLQPVYRQYFGLFGWAVSGRRGYASAGVLTPIDRLTSLGSATYKGQMVADGWNNPLTPSLFENRGRIWGALTLEANFLGGSVEGEITDLWAEPPGTAFSNCCWEQFSNATWIEVLPGSITGNRLHAEWEGRDTRTSPEPRYTFLGTSGSLLGEFYGPHGEEVGGVITGQRESTDQLVNGVFGADRR